MTDQDLFNRAMLAYDNEGRHSEGIRAVVDLVRATTRAEIEADVERYPLMQRVKEQTELRRMADDDAASWRTRYGNTHDELLYVRSALQAALARIDELDAKRSDSPT
jgi:hypothetical protein